jgi:2-dehydropantoate 2-reductase
MSDVPRIVVLGAGSIGCFVGGCWAAAGLPVRFIGRATFAHAIAEHGLTLTDERGWKHHLDPLDFGTDPAVLADANIIALCVKSGATATAAEDIARHARPGATVLSLQNGIGNIDVLRETLGTRFALVRGMVPYNVAWLGGGRFHKGVAGQLWAEDGETMRDLRDRVGASPAGLSLSDDMLGVAWGKLLINLNNAVCALSGRLLAEELSQRDYRRVLAASMREGLALLAAAGIEPARVGAVGPKLLPWVMVAPDWLFTNVFMKKWKIDAKARSSMADDLAAGRKTEVDVLNGELVRLAERLGRDAPVNRKVVELIRAAEKGGRRDWGPDELRREVLS